MQRPSAAWTLNEKVLEDGSQIACCVNNTTVLTLEVCSAADADVAERLSKAEHGLLLLLGVRKTHGSRRFCSDVEFRVARPGLAKGLEPLAAALRGRALTACLAASDHNAVERYAKTDEPFRLVPLVVDRVCTGGELTQSDQKVLLVNTTTERGAAK